MAAFMRLSRLSSGFKCNAVLLVNKEIISRNTCFVKEASCRFFGSLPNRLNNYIKFGDYNQRLYSVNTATTSTSTNQNVRRERRPPKSPKEESPLHIQLQELDILVRRTGRLDSDQVNKLLKAMTGTLSNHEAVMLLKCTGSLLVKESPKERIEIFEKMWNKILSSGCEMNIQLYNAMLRTKLENNQTFSPVEVLTDLENVKQLVPNKMTYRLLVAQFCETGDIEGASKILDHMKSQKLSIDEEVFNALLKGHMRKGDRAAAEDVLASMKDYGIEPSGNTYETYMSCLAEKGDVEGVKQILSGTDAAFSPQNIYHVLQTFVQSGHENKIDFLLEFMERKDRMKHNHDALNCIFQLVATGHDDAALKVYNTMDRTSFTGEQSRNLGQPLLRCMIMKRRPVDKVFEIFEKLSAQNIARDKETIAYMALVYAGDSLDYVIEIFQRLKKEGMPLKEDYFRSIFRGANQRKDIEGMYSVVKFYAENTDSSTFPYTMVPWIRILQSRGETLDNIYARIKDAGFSEGEITKFKTVLLISDGCFDEAEKMLVKLPIQWPTYHFIRETANGFYKNKQDIPMLLKFTKSMSSRWRDPCHVNTGVLLNTLSHNEASTEVAVKLVNAWKKSDMKIKFTAEKSIKEQLKVLNVPAQTINEVNKFMIDSGDEENSLKIQDLKGMKAELLEPTLENVKHENSTFANVLKETALTKFCLEGMVEKADALKKLLDSQGFIYGFSNLKALGIMAAKNKGNLEEALEYLHQLELKFPSHENYANLILHISNLYLKSGKFNDAVDLLKSYRSKHEINLDFQLSDSCCQLVQSCAESIGSKEANEIMNLLFELGFVKKGAFSMLNKMMSGCFQNSDIEEAVSNFELSVTEYQRAPFFTDLFINLIEKEDAERLQRVVDQATTVLGETDTLIHLLACFVECGKLKQARKIVATPGLRASKEPLMKASRRFFSMQKEKELQQLVEVTKDLPGIDRDEMLFQLIRYHSNRSKTSEKMLDVLSMYGEEGVFPKSRTLRYIAKVLESRNEPIPFNVPPPVNTTKTKESEPSETDKMKTKQSEPSETGKLKTKQSSKTGKLNLIDSEVDLDVKKSIEFKDVEGLMQMKKHLDAEGSPEKTMTFVVDVVKFLLHQKESQKLHKFIIALAKEGCVDILSTLQKLTIIPDSWIAPIRRQLFSAYIQTNNAKEFVDQFKDKPKELLASLTLYNLEEMSKKDPEVFASLETMIMKNSSNEESRSALNNLYYFYLLDGQYDRAGRILEENPYLKNKVNIDYFCQRAVRQEKAEAVRHLMKLHQLENGRQLQASFNSLLLIECKKGDWNSAMKVYEEAISKGLTFSKDFRIHALQSLNSLLLENSQPTPWQPGMLEKMIAERTARGGERKKQEDSSSSSSDSSDSDSEKERV